MAYNLLNCVLSQLCQLCQDRYCLTHCSLTFPLGEKKKTQKTVDLSNFYSLASSPQGMTLYGYKIPLVL